MKTDKLNVPKDLQFTDMGEALSAANGLVASIPFWHDALVDSAVMLREKMLELENNLRITEEGSKALGWLNFLFTMYGDDSGLFLTHALSWLFFRAPNVPGVHPCRTVAEGIVKFSGLEMTFHK